MTTQMNLRATLRLSSLRRASLLTALIAGLCGCTGAIMDVEGTSATEVERETPRVAGTFSPASTAGGILNTFHHPASVDGAASTDPREALARMAAEGPPAYRSRVHGCRKMRYRTIGRMLSGLGVDLSAEGETSAGRLWRSADQALGAPNYAARIPETTEMTTASASRLFDILVQAAPEIIANMPAQERCQVGGAGVSIFEADGTCSADGLTCLLGEPASEEHVALCDAIVERATTPDKGQIIAVASMLSAASTCE